MTQCNCNVWLASHVAVHSTTAQVALRLRQCIDYLDILCSDLNMTTTRIICRYSLEPGMHHLLQ